MGEEVKEKVGAEEESGGGRRRRKTKSPIRGEEPNIQATTFLGRAKRNRV